VKSRLYFAKIWGIPIGIHPSWFLIFILITWSLATGYAPLASRQIDRILIWALGAITALLFFGSVLAHELGHSYLALREKIPVKNITLFIFGGLAQITQEPRSPGAEFRIAIAGPITSLLLALFFAVISFFLQKTPLFHISFQYLARINLMLALFNMIPGFPLDGGRVLRAIVWWWTKSYYRATQVACLLGQLIAYIFIGMGIISTLTGNIMNGVWLVFIGFFLHSTASASSQQTALQHTLQGVKVSQVMSRDLIKVSALTPISQLIYDWTPARGYPLFYITEGDRPYGMITLKEITAVPDRLRRFTSTSQIMVPFSRLVRVDPDTELLDVLNKMAQAGTILLPVMEGEELVGSISQDQIRQYLQFKSATG